MSNAGGDAGGIPNVVDRWVRQAVLQVLEPIFEPTFHESSHDFRPRRVRAIIICQKKRDRHLHRHRLARGVWPKSAAKTAFQRVGIWRRSASYGMHQAYGNAWFHQRLTSRGAHWHTLNPSPRAYFIKKRLKALEAKVAQDGIVLTEDQLAALERAKQEKEAHLRERSKSCKPIWMSGSRTTTKNGLTAEDTATAKRPRKRSRNRSTWPKRNARFDHADSLVK